MIFRKWHYWTIIFYCLLSTALVHAAPLKPLDLDQAFKFTAMAKDYQTAVLQWQIAPGYYLYRDRFKIRAIQAGNMELAPPILPYNYTEKAFPPLGKFAVYKGDIYIIQPILNSNHESITLQVSYQGCSQDGFCYPPTSKVVTLNLSDSFMQPTQGVDMDVAPATNETTNTIQSKINPQDKITQLFSTKNWWAIVIGFFIFGVLISLTPCVLPMIPILSGIIVGQGKISHSRSFVLSLCYVLGMAVTYATAGVLFGYIGSNIQADFQQPWLISIFVAIFVLMALSLFGLFELQLPASLRNKFANFSTHQQHGTLISVVLMGVFSTLVLSPCVTPPLVGVLAYISQTGNAAIGGIALFIMGIGMGLPLLLIGAFGPKLLPHTGKWMVAIKNFMGVLMLAVAIWMLARIIPDWVTLLLWGALVIGCGVSLGALSSSQGHWNHVRKAIGILLFVYGIVLVIGGSIGNTNPLKPLANQTPAQTTSLPFIKVTSVQDVYHELNLPQHKNKPVMLDFYADWCIACKELEAGAFSDPHVKALLKNTVLLQADVTRNDMNAKNLQQHFGVVAPPTILFFNAQHREIKSARIVGALSARNFITHLKQLTNFLF